MSHVTCHPCRFRQLRSIILFKHTRNLSLRTLVKYVNASHAAQVSIRVAVSDVPTIDSEGIASRDNREFVTLTQMALGSREA